MELIINNEGYACIPANPQPLPIHRIVAEWALGRRLLANEVVHHQDCDKLNNRPSNLLICTREYHNVIHQRIDALTSSGHVDRRKCRYCKAYDSPDNLYAGSGTVYHRSCHNEYTKSRRAQLTTA